MLRDDLKNKILLFDGAMATELQKHDPAKNDFPNDRYGFNDGLNITHPEWVVKIYHDYLKAGADCITTNTFGSNLIKLDEYGFGNRTVELNRNAALLARRALEPFKNEDRYVMGCIGPTGYMPSMERDPEYERSNESMEDAFHQQAAGLIEGGVDGIVLETSMDVLELKTAINAIKRTGTDIPIIANITLGQADNMLLGTPVDAAYTTISPLGIDAFGLNCSTGPEEMINSIRWLNDNSEHPISVVPNAGIPDMNSPGLFPMTPENMADIMSTLLSKYHNIRIIGGCCGTTPEHIRQLRNVIDKHVGQ